MVVPRVEEDGTSDDDAREEQSDELLTQVMILEVLGQEDADGDDGSEEPQPPSCKCFTHYKLLICEGMKQLLNNVRLS